MKSMGVYRFKAFKIYFRTLYQKIIRRNFLSQTESYSFLLRKMNYTVQRGPFKGMKYIEKSNGSVLFPKIAGMYESQIQEIIELIITSDYTNYIDIGCGEGYYAVGIAYKLSAKRVDFKVYAYDIDPDAINNLNILARLNDVRQFIELGNLFKPNDFDRFGEGTVVICDIEGAERELVDPSKSKSLLKFDLLIEIHDGGPRSNIIKECLNARFEDTHTIKFFYHKEYDKRLFRLIDYKYEKAFMNERREFGLEWMWIKRKEDSELKIPS